MNHKRLHIKTFVKDIASFQELEMFIKQSAGEIVGVKTTPKGLLEIDYKI